MDPMTNFAIWLGDVIAIRTKAFIMISALRLRNAFLECRMFYRYWQCRWYMR